MTSCDYVAAPTGDEEAHTQQQWKDMISRTPKILKGTVVSLLVVVGVTVLLLAVLPSRSHPPTPTQMNTHSKPALVSPTSSLHAAQPRPPVRVPAQVSRATPTRYLPTLSSIFARSPFARSVESTAPSATLRTEPLSVHSVFEQGRAFSSGDVVPVTHEYNRVSLNLPKSFECGEFVFTSPRPFWDQGQDSVTASYGYASLKKPSTPLGSAVAKFALELNNAPASDRSESSWNTLANEVAILHVLHTAGVPNIVPMLGACDLDSGLRVLVMPQVHGIDVTADYYGTYRFSLSDQSQPPEEVLANERILIRHAMETMLGMLQAGVINNDQYHNIILDKSTGGVTFIDFGAAHLISELDHAKAAWKVPAFLNQFFVMVPSRQTSIVRPLLEELLVQFPPPPEYATNELVLEMWDNVGQSATVLPHWKAFYGVQAEKNN